MALVVFFFVFVLIQNCEAAGHWPDGRRELHDTPDPGAVRANGLCATVVEPQGYECQEFEVVYICIQNASLFRFVFKNILLQVKTEDGYILTMHRIPRGRGRGRDGRRPGRQLPAVLLQHGVLMVSLFLWVELTD